MRKLELILLLHLQMRPGLLHKVILPAVHSYGSVLRLNFFFVYHIKSGLNTQVMEDKMRLLTLVTLSSQQTELPFDTVIFCFMRFWSMVKIHGDERSACVALYLSVR